MQKYILLSLGGRETRFAIDEKLEQNLKESLKDNYKFDSRNNLILEKESMEESYRLKQSVFKALLNKCEEYDIPDHLKFSFEELRKQIDNKTNVYSSDLTKMEELLSKATDFYGTARNTFVTKEVGQEQREKAQEVVSEVEKLTESMDIDNSADFSSSTSDKLDDFKSILEVAKEDVTLSNEVPFEAIDAAFDRIEICATMDEYVQKVGSNNYDYKEAIKNSTEKIVLPPETKLEDVAVEIIKTSCKDNNTYEKVINYVQDKANFNSKAKAALDSFRSDLKVRGLSSNNLNYFGDRLVDELARICEASGISFETMIKEYYSSSSSTRNNSVLNRFILEFTKYNNGNDGTRALLESLIVKKAIYKGILNRRYNNYLSEQYRNIDYDGQGRIYYNDDQIRSNYAPSSTSDTSSTSSSSSNSSTNPSSSTGAYSGGAVGGSVSSGGNSSLQSPRSNISMPSSPSLPNQTGNNSLNPIALPTPPAMPNVPNLEVPRVPFNKQKGSISSNIVFSIRSSLPFLNGLSGTMNHNFGIPSANYGIHGLNLRPGMGFGMFGLGASMAQRGEVPEAETEDESDNENLIDTDEEEAIKNSALDTGIDGENEDEEEGALTNQEDAPIASNNAESYDEEADQKAKKKLKLIIVISAAVIVLIILIVVVVMEQEWKPKFDYKEPKCEEVTIHFEHREVDDITLGLEDYVKSMTYSLTKDLQNPKRVLYQAIAVAVRTNAQNLNSCTLNVSDEVDAIYDFEVLQENHAQYKEISNAVSYVEGLVMVFDEKFMDVSFDEFCYSVNDGINYTIMNSYSGPNVPSSWANTDISNDNFKSCSCKSETLRSKDKDNDCWIEEKFNTEKDENGNRIPYYRYVDGGDGNGLSVITSHYISSVLGYDDDEILRFFYPNDWKYNTVLEDSKDDSVNEGYGEFNTGCYWWPLGSTSPTSGNIYGGTPASVRITSTFGPRIHPITGVPQKAHGAVDIGTATNTPVIATKDGVVTTTIGGCSVGNHDCGGGYGNNVRIDHGGGVESLYAHLTSIVVANGERVKQGQIIAYSGNTGRSTGPHLHFEIRLNGEKVDPELYVSGSNPRPNCSAYIPPSGVMTGDDKAAVCTLFKNAGYSNEQIAGVMANAEMESGFNPNAFNSSGGGQGAYGLFQWRGARQRALKSLSDYNTVATQAGFALSELSSSEKAARTKLLASSSPSDASYNFCVGYERPGINSQEIAVNCQPRKSNQNLNSYYNFAVNGCK